MTVLKIQKIGDEVGVVLDEEALKLLGAEVGDTLLLQAGAGGVVVTKEAGETARQVELARGILNRYRKTFEALAK